MSLRPRARNPTHLFVSPASEWPSVALRRAAAMARRAAATLVLLRLDHGEQDVAGRTADWVRETIGLDLEADSVVVADGEIAECAIAVAQLARPQTIVIGPGRTALEGHVLGAVVRQTRRTVLVAREREEAGAVLVATDLRDERYPVVRAGLALAAGQEAPLVLLHNVEPEPEVTPFPAPPPSGVDPILALARNRQSRLRQLVRRFDVRADAVVRWERSTANAILGVAREHHAHTVVLGTHVGPVRPLWGDHVASRVSREPSHSVFLVPVSHDARPEPFWLH